MENDFFLILNSLTREKKDLWNDIDEDDYNPFITNRAVSLLRDGVFWANELNMVAQNDIPKKAQYYFYFHGLRKHGFNETWKGKWPKLDISEDVKILMQYYKYNIRRAQEALELITPEQLAIIKEKVRLEYDKEV